MAAVGAFTAAVQDTAKTVTTNTLLGEGTILVRSSDFSRLWAAARQQRDEGQQQRQDADVAAGFDIVLDPPVGAGSTADGYPLARDQVPVAVVRRVAKKVGQEESDNLAHWVGPADDVGVGNRTLAKVLRHQLDHRDELHRP